MPKLRTVKRIAWVGRSAVIRDYIQNDPPGEPDNLISIVMARKKGDHYDWSSKHWPPRKVEIIIREIE